MGDIFEFFKKEKSEQKSSAPEYLVVGLGNPDAKYASTRHNSGFMVIDRLSSEYGVKIDRAKYHGLTALCNISGKSVLLLKPLTYMNSSGISVREASAFYKIPAENIIIIVDDISLDVGRIRIRTHGSAGGHNGLKSINECLSSQEYIRIKMGVGNKPFPEYDLCDWVLGEIPKEQRDSFAKAADNAVSAIGMIIAGDTIGAMNKFN